MGMMAIRFYLVLLVSSAQRLFADHFDVSLNATTWMGRIGLLVLPPVAYWVTYRICLGLQRGDLAVLEHGVETGIITRLPPRRVHRGPPTTGRRRRPRPPHPPSPTRAPPYRNG